jgi:putative endonuclease
VKSYFVYILRCADGTLYCGYTDNIEKRVATHNSAKGAKYTKPAARRPVILLKSLKFATKNDALKCEWWIKNKLTRDEKTSLTERQLKLRFNQYMKKRA